MYSFTSNCTLPPEGTNYVASPPIRGTLQILWSSLSVLILCTWSIVHLNVPPRIEAEKFIPRIRRDIRRHYAKVCWMLFNLLAPEWIFVKSYLDWKSAKDVHCELRDQAKEEIDPVPWSYTHTHYANMGGFGISFKHLAKSVSNNSSADIQDARQERQERSQSPTDLEKTGANTCRSFDWLEWLTKISRALLDTDADSMAAHRAEFVLRWAEKVFSDKNAADQGWQIDNTNSKLLLSLTPNQMKESFSQDDDPRYLYPSICRNLLLLKADLWILDAAQLLKARQLGIITSLPDISDDDLKDRDKSGYLVRLIAFGQTCWIMLQFVVRACSEQPNTQLEVMVFAFAICSMATYYFVWYRLKDVTHTTVLKAARHPNTGDELLSIAAQGRFHNSLNIRSTIWISNGQLTSASIIKGLKDSRLLGVVASLIVALFGALHCIAWNYTFPTKADQIIWRVCSLLTTVIFPLYYILAILTNLLVCCFSLPPKVSRTADWLYMNASLACFVVVRLLILVEVFRCLGFQPPAAFQATWVKDVPYIS